MKQVNYRKLFEAQFDIAKVWYTLSMIIGVLILLIDVLVVLFGQWEGLLAVIVTLCTVLNMLFLWRSSRIRDVAEIMLRKFELHDAFGWEISPRELADFLATATRKVKKAAELAVKNEYFGSKESKGAKRILENLEESAWWSKHQSNRMATIVGAFGSITFLFALLTLLLFLEINLFPASGSIAKTIIIVIVLVFSGGYIRLALDYDYFARQAGKIEEIAFRSSQEKNISEIEAINLYHDYQIERAISPLLPTWLYNSMKKELNRLWSERKG